MSDVSSKVVGQISFEYSRPRCRLRCRSLYIVHRPMQLQAAPLLPMRLQAVPLLHRHQWEQAPQWLALPRARLPVRIDLRSQDPSPQPWQL